MAVLESSDDQVDYGKATDLTLEVNMVVFESSVDQVDYGKDFYCGFVSCTATDLTLEGNVAVLESSDDQVDYGKATADLTLELNMAVLESSDDQVDYGRACDEQKKQETGSTVDEVENGSDDASNEEQFHGIHEFGLWAGDLEKKEANTYTIFHLQVSDLGVNEVFMESLEKIQYDLYKSLRAEETVQETKKGIRKRISEATVQMTTLLLQVYMMIKIAVVRQTEFSKEHKSWLWFNGEPVSQRDKTGSGRKKARINYRSRVTSRRKFSVCVFVLVLLVSDCTASQVESNGKVLRSEVQSLPACDGYQIGKHGGNVIDVTANSKQTKCGARLTETGNANGARLYHTTSLNTVARIAKAKDVQDATWMVVLLCIISASILKFFQRQLKLAIILIISQITNNLAETEAEEKTGDQQIISEKKNELSIEVSKTTTDWEDFMLPRMSELKTAELKTLQPEDLVFLLYETETSGKDSFYDLCLVQQTLISHSYVGKMHCGAMPDWETEVSVEVSKTALDCDLMLPGISETAELKKLQASYVDLCACLDFSHNLVNGTLFLDDPPFRFVAFANIKNVYFDQCFVTHLTVPLKKQKNSRVLHCLKTMQKELKIMDTVIQQIPKSHYHVGKKGHSDTTCSPGSRPALPNVWKEGTHLVSMDKDEVESDEDESDGKKHARLIVPNLVTAHEVEYDEETNTLSMRFKKQIPRTLYQLLLLFVQSKRPRRYSDTEGTAEKNNEAEIDILDTSSEVQKDDDSVVLNRIIPDRVMYCDDNDFADCGKNPSAFLLRQNDTSVKFPQTIREPRQKLQLSQHLSVPQQNQGTVFTKRYFQEAEANVRMPQAVDTSFRDLKTKRNVKPHSDPPNTDAYTGKSGKIYYPPPRDDAAAWLRDVTDFPQPYFDETVIQQTYRDLLVYFMPDVQIPNIPDFEPLLSIIDQISRGRPPAPHVSMRYELLRFCTLRSYPKEDKPYLIKLAEAGFYYASDGDGVVCYCCGIRRYNWTAADRPMEVHKRINPTCKFLTKNLEVNVRNNYNGPISSALMFIDGIPEPPESQEPPEDVNNESVLERNRTPAGRPQNASSSSQQLGINTAIPKHSQYATKTARVASYVGWPDTASHNPEELADAGFFYAGFGDCVRCFYCGIGLRHWTREDNPWIEHARWAKNCVFVKQKKGEEFINLVQLAVQYSQDNASQANAEGNELQAQELESHLLSDAAQSVLEMGYQPRIIKKAIEDILRGNRQARLTAQSLMERILQLEEAEATPSAPAPAPQAAASTSSPTEGAASNKAKEQSKPSEKEQKGKTEKKKSSLVDKSKKDSDTGPQDPRQIKAENEQLKEQTLCKVCLDQTVCIVFLPCGHLVTCADCAPAMRKCPICRALVKGTVRTYMS